LAPPGEGRPRPGAAGALRPALLASCAAGEPARADVRRSVGERSAAERDRSDRRRREDGAERAGSELVVVANRLPVTRAPRARPNQPDEWDLSPGGLVSALTPVLQKRVSTWVGWPGAGPAPRRLESQGIQLRPVSLTRAQVEGYYAGFSNHTIWPLYHDAVRPPRYHRPWWRCYVDVNRCFAEAAIAEAAPGAVVWVHDYHLQLVPRMIRERRPDLRVGFFLRIPFPPQELFAQIPWRRQILEGLLGADVVGFQTVVGARNFAVLSRRYAGAEGEDRKSVVEGKNGEDGVDGSGSKQTARYDYVAHT